MPDKPKRKLYLTPSFRKLDANKAKAALEAKAVPMDMGARAMLNSISNSKAAGSKTSKSIQEH